METGTMYEIRIKGELDAVWSDWFADMEVETAVSGETTLRGALPDQAALHGLLARIRDLGLPLLSVNKIENNRSQI